ncbi:MAG: immune inhibitor [Cryptosporangiaceae bacterium]|nr:immune inhibitor [Cryptosporangiaceae bacterium]
MRKVRAGLLGLTVATGLVITLSTSAFGSPATGGKPVATPAKNVAQGDDLPNALEAKRRDLRQQALNQVLAGKLKPEKRNGSLVAKVGTSASAKPVSGKALKGAAAAAPADQYVELSREKTDKIFVILAEFGNERHPDFPDKDINPATPGPVRWDGPLHNQIPAPNRAVDNSTDWNADYSQKHFQDLYFGTGPGVESVKTYFERQSSGRYSVDGQVSDWVKVKYNEARYGRSTDPVPDGAPGDDPAVCSRSNCGNVHYLIQDAANQWVADQKAKGRTSDQIKADLAQYDQWDRYDYDHDGNFNEPDGYIDHFQIVHAGGDEANVDPQQGEDAIWSHRWYAFESTGVKGPAGDLHGGAPVGDTGVWIGDYTIQPENGGLSVFAHEYTHDLGEPDYYDISGKGDNSIEHWSLMAQSRLNAKGDQAIGTKPGDLGAAEKFNLGWLDYEVAVAGQDRTIKLGPSEYNNKNPQALVVVLPKKKLVTQLVKPKSGANEWWSGSGDGLENTLTRNVTLPAGSPSLTFQAAWDIEDCGADACDYAYVEVNDGSGWKSIPGSITNPAEGNGIDGDHDWTPATFDLSAFAGKKVDLRFRYSTDGGTGGEGFFVDDLKLAAGDTTVLTDGAETGLNGWTSASRAGGQGFTINNGIFTKEYDHRYIATNRRYVSFDQYLQYGPYNWGWRDNPDPAKNKQNLAEHFPYQQGVLVTYVDTSVGDNNTTDHPGRGMALIVDAHPQPLYKLDGLPWRERVQIYDAPFGKRKADSLTLHSAGQTNYIRGQDAAPVFDDTKQYWNAAVPNGSVKVANAGVKLSVISENGNIVILKLGKSTPAK